MKKVKLSTQDTIKNITLNICAVLADNATGYGEIADHFRTVGTLAGENNFDLAALQQVVTDMQTTVTAAMDYDIAKRIADNQCPAESKAICKSAYQGRLSDQVKKFLVPSYNESVIELHSEKAILAHFYRSDAGAAKIHSTPPKAKPSKKVLTAAGTANRLPATASPQVDTVAAIRQIETGHTVLPQATILAALVAGLADGSYSLAAVTDCIDKYTAELANADAERVGKEIAALELVIENDRKQSMAA